ncbi:MAG: hypothetical protein JSW55_12365, partial [Chloroflexota bacterium]
MFTHGKSHLRSLIIFASTTLGLLIVISLLALLPARANVSTAGALTVCPAGPPGCDFDNIQSAVNAAADEDVVKIAAGVYTGVNGYGGLAQVVYISRSLTISGGYNTAFDEPPDPLANATIIDAEGDGRALYVAEGADVTVSGLHFTGVYAKDLGGDPVFFLGCFDFGGG